MVVSLFVRERVLGAYGESLVFAGHRYSLSRTTIYMDDMVDGRIVDA